MIGCKLIGTSASRTGTRAIVTGTDDAPLPLPGTCPGAGAGDGGVAGGGTEGVAGAAGGGVARLCIVVCEDAAVCADTAVCADDAVAFVPAEAVAVALVPAGGGVP
jgi:hypothetical protein